MLYNPWYDRSGNKTVIKKKEKTPEDAQALHRIRAGAYRNRVRRFWAGTHVGQ